MAFAVGARAQTIGSSSNGLVAAFGFDESSGTVANDASGSNNNGQLFGATRISSGKYGGALVFDGASATVLVPDAPSLDLTTAMTLEAWVYPTQTPVGFRDIVYKATNLYYLEGSSPQNGGVPAVGGTFATPQLFGTAPLPQSTWSHLAATYDGSTLRLYVNGTQVASRAQSAPISTSNSALTIGGDAVNGQYWAGYIDEVRVYNRALSPGEIATDRDTPVNQPFASQPPLIALSAPLPGGGAVGGVITTAATLSSPAGVQSVEFFADGVSFALDPTPPYLVGWNSTNASNSTHTLTAVAHDYAGGSVTSAPVAVNTVNPAFTNEIVVPGITSADSIVFTPDGRMLVGDLTEKIWVVLPGANAPLATPMLSLDNSTLGNEQGLMDLALDPSFGTNGFIYVFYTNSAAGNLDRVSRFTASGNTINTSTERVLWQDDHTTAEHHGGTVAFGPDGKLYITTGDHFDATSAQDLTSYQGKVLRINADGTIPTDNPFYDGSGPNKDEIYALGLRNPYRAAFDPVTGNFYIGDVGGNDINASIEEVDVLSKGANFGWATCEGPCANAGMTNPLWWYTHAGHDACVTGGFVYRGTSYPAEYYGNYFVADYTQNVIRRLVLDANGNLQGVLNFIPPDGTYDTDIGDPVKVIQGPDGALYYVDIGFNNEHTPNAASIRRIRYTINNQPPVVQVSATPTAGLPPLTVNFSSAGTHDPEGQTVTYSWNFGDGTTSTAANPTHTYATAGPYIARLTASDGVSNTLSSDLDITVGNPPVPTLLTPANGLVFKAGDVISYSGSGTDIEDGNLPASAFSWTIIFHHETHVHPGQGPIVGSKTGTFTVPTTGHDFSGNTSYEIILTVTDSNGLQGSTSTFIYPNKVNLNFDANPSSLYLDIDGVQHNTPFVHDTVPNFQHTISAPDQPLGGTTYNFSTWSDGGASTHTIVVPPGGESLLASFAPAGAQGLVAAYGFEETSGTNVNDASSFANNGAMNAGVTRTASGKFGQALSFDGTSGVVNIPDSASLDLTAGMTLEAWVYPTAGGAIWRDVIYKSTDIYFLNSSSDQPSGAPAGGGTFSNVNAITYGLSALPLNTWSHLATTYDGVNITLFLNGAQVAQRTQTGTINTSSAVLSFGADAVYGQFFAGRLDEVRVYNRPLAQSEIQHDMNTSVDPRFNDTDGDGVLDGVDNCPFIPNASQANSDAFPAGDACQCGDVDVNGAANAADVTLLRSSLTNSAVLSAAGLARCGVTPPGGICNVLDVSVLRRALAALPPGLAQVCPAQFSQ
ncbi:MAG TPA: LamG-like jellyroll fold domain-containing protein [Myxococcota bacterium]|nr:LamG-like jellyroll fold domain-containing protein [Myxococcota bacterium]